MIVIRENLWSCCLRDKIPNHRFSFLGSQQFLCNNNNNKNENDWEKCFVDSAKPWMIYVFAIYRLRSTIRGVEWSRREWKLIIFILVFFPLSCCSCSLPRNEHPYLQNFSIYFLILLKSSKCFSYKYFTSINFNLLSLSLSPDSFGNKLMEITNSLLVAILF